VATWKRHWGCIFIIGITSLAEEHWGTVATVNFFWTHRDLILFCAPPWSRHFVDRSVHLASPPYSRFIHKDTWVTSPIVLEPDAIVRLVIIFVLMIVGWEHAILSDFHVGWTQIHYSLAVNVLFGAILNSVLCHCICVHLPRSSLLDQVTCL
jgi:hypothetical protein